MGQCGGPRGLHLGTLPQDLRRAQYPCSDPDTDLHGRLHPALLPEPIGSRAGAEPSHPRHDRARAGGHASGAGSELPVEGVRPSEKRPPLRVLRRNVS